MASFFKFLALLSLQVTLVHAQCAHDPRIQGDTILCPNSSGLLTTQTGDSYQWFARPWGGSSATPISGANAATFAVSSPNVLNYFSVETTVSGCTERSPEVLLDEYAFLPPYVLHSGNFNTGGNGEIIVCEGDTHFLTLGVPYDTMITWYLNSAPIQGQTANTIAITQAGFYTCSASISMCPNGTYYLGVQIEVIFEPCSVDATPPTSLSVSLYPNPSKGFFTLQLPSHPAQLSLSDATGRTVWSGFQQFMTETHQTSNLAPGIYWLNITTTQDQVSHYKRVFIQP